MGLFEQFPYSNFHEMNLDWILQQIKKIDAKTDNFINLNKIKYSDPIAWDITSSYEANTVVIDSQTGNAYISTKAVPYGVHISNAEYWTQIYNYADQLHTLREQIGADEEGSPTASAPRAVGDLVFLNGVLYRVIAPMIAGDRYVPGSNCEDTTIEEELNNIDSKIGKVASKIVDVTEHGVDNTGTTAVDSAFSSILNTFKNALIYVPNGTYKFDGVINTANNTSQILIAKEAKIAGEQPTARAPFFYQWGNRFTNSNIIYMSTYSLSVGSGYDSLPESVRGEYATVAGINPVGGAAIYGSTETSKLGDRTGYPIAIEGITIADSPTNPSTIGGGYFHMIREAGTNGNTVGLEIDNDIKIPTQEMTPNSVPGTGGNFAGALVLSNGGGDHASGQAEELSSAIMINKNPQKFKHGIIVTNESISGEFIVVPADAGGSIAWYEPLSAGVGDRPAAIINGSQSGGYGNLTIQVYRPASSNYITHKLDVNTNLQGFETVQQNNPKDGDAYVDGGGIHYFYHGQWYHVAHA